MLGAVIASPWLFGSVQPWAYLLLCLIIGSATAVWLVLWLSRPAGLLRSPKLVWALLAVLGFIVVQMAPLPAPVAMLLAPRSAEAQLKQRQVFDEASVREFLPADLRAGPKATTLSASAGATRRSLYLFLAYACTFLVMSTSYGKWEDLRYALMTITTFSFVMVVFALAQKFSQTSAIYWFHTPRFGGSIFGPFVNRDHFAAYMNMSFGVTLGMILTTSEFPELQVLTTWRERAAWLSSPRASQTMLLGFAAALMGASVCLAVSRGGIASLAASLGIVGTFVAWRSGERNRGKVLAAVAMLVVAAVVWLGWEPVVSRLGTLSAVLKDPVSDSRFIATLDTLRMFAASPIFGFGFGAYEHVFPIFQSPAIQAGRFVHAHNDYAQLLAEGGLVGAALTVLLAIQFVRTLLRRFNVAPAAGRLVVGGMAVGIIAMALHSLVDFSLHIPANALMFAALCGLSLAAIRLHHAERRVRTHTIRGRRMGSFERPLHAHGTGGSRP